MMNVDTSVFSVLRRGAVRGAGLLALLLVAVGCDSQDLGDANPETPTVNEIATNVEALSTFGQALQQVGPANVLTGSGPYTVFAPQDDAFTPPIAVEGNTGVLRKVLQHHVVDGDSLKSADIDIGDTVQPLAGSELTIDTTDAGNLAVNRAPISNPDVSAQEGVVHVVDGLLADAVDRATLTPQFTIFARLVKEADIESALRGPGADDGRTIFAPTNEALLELLDDNGNGEVESDEIPTNAAAVLQHHVLDSVFLAADVPGSETAVTTLEGTDVTVVRSGGDVTVGSGDEEATVIQPDGPDDSTPDLADVLVDNGVIHGIDTVLVP